MSALDVAGILERAGADADAPQGSQAWALAQVGAAVTRLVDAGNRLIPRNATLVNTNVHDSYEIELVASVGELRSFARALAALEPQS